MAKQTVRDVIGHPTEWLNCISDEPVAIPAVTGARIINVFSTTNEISVHWRAETGFETLSVFRFSDPRIQASVVTALIPGMFLLEALETTLWMA